MPGFGFIVPRVENRRINACTWSSIKWAHRAPDDTLLIRSFVGGGHHEELVSLDDGELVTIVREELREIVGLTAEPVFSKVYRWFQGMPKYTVGHLERIAAIDELRKEHRGLLSHRQQLSRHRHRRLREERFRRCRGHCGAVIPELYELR